jgi:hypothetical protein
MPWTSDPPTYNSRYGWKDGAQDDIFIAAPDQSGTSSSGPTSTSTSTSGSAPTTSIPSRAGLSKTVGYRIPGRLLSGYRHILGPC